MEEIQRLDTCIELCARLKEQIRLDCDVNAHQLGGETLPAYENARKDQLQDIKNIYSKLATLRFLMSNV